MERINPYLIIQREKQRPTIILVLINTARHMCKGLLARRKESESETLRFIIAVAMKVW
jgi:hypothetical protein